MQSVSQYDTGDAADPSRSNREVWGFTPTNQSSGYLNRYHVRFGPAENPAATVRDDGMFSVHYAHLAAEFWVDTTDGWLAVVDGSSRYAMVERFQYEEHEPYPGKASVIFWTNGPALRLSSEGVASVSDGSDGRVALLHGSGNQQSDVPSAPRRGVPIGNRLVPDTGRQRIPWSDGRRDRHQAAAGSALGEWQGETFRLFRSLFPRQARGTFL